MSKKWITFLVVAVIGALMLPAVASAACVVTVVNSVAFTDTTAAAAKADPQPLIGGDTVSNLTGSLTGSAGGNAIAAVRALNPEGVAERTSDILITDDNAGNFCFTQNNIITVTFNGQLTTPSAQLGVVTPLAIPTYLDIYDSTAGKLNVSGSVTLGFSANVPASIVTITINQAGTAGNITTGTGAALRLKNLRIDATSVSGTNVNAILSSNPAGGLSGTSVLVATDANATLNFASAAGAQGIHAGANPAANSTASAVTVPANVATANSLQGTGFGIQSSNSGLKLYSTFGFQENFALAFRTGGGTCASQTVANDTCYSGVANDFVTVPTSMIFALTNIPSGVTVTFPSSISTSGNNAANSTLTWTVRAGQTLTNAGTAGPLTVIYDTAVSGPTANGKDVIIETADNADIGTPVGTPTLGTLNPNCQSNAAGTAEIPINGASPCDANPKVGVKISGQSGAGSVTLRAAFGRADVGTSTQTPDDVAADTTVFPRYTGSARRIVSSTKNTFFIVVPTRTTLLFPFVTTAGGFNSGVAVVNTCTDAGAFTTGSTCTTAGGVTFYFVGINTDTGAAYTGTLETDLGKGGVAIPKTTCAAANLDANGRLAAGASFSCGLNNMLSLVSGAPTHFTGYVIAVLQSNEGHGFSVQFNAGLAPYAADNALVIESGVGTRGNPEGGVGQ